jgi:hypothetical protein
VLPLGMVFGKHSHHMRESKRWKSLFWAKL